MMRRYFSSKKYQLLVLIIFRYVNIINVCLRVRFIKERERKTYFLNLYFVNGSLLI